MSLGAMLVPCALSSIHDCVSAGVVFVKRRTCHASPPAPLVFFGPPRSPPYRSDQQIPTTSSLFAGPALLILGDDNVRFRAHCPKSFTEGECLGLLAVNHRDGFDLALDVIDVTAQFVFIGMA